MAQRSEDHHNPHETSAKAAETDRVRRCPWCGSKNITFVQRGFTGPTDERDQYTTCNNCKRLAYEIISRSARDMRLGQYRSGGVYRDSLRQTRYTINRVLKVGANEYLLYVKPVVRDGATTRASQIRRGRY